MSLKAKKWVLKVKKIIKLSVQFGPAYSLVAEIDCKNKGGSIAENFSDVKIKPKMLNVAQILGFYSYSNKLKALLQKANISWGKKIFILHIFQNVYEKKILFKPYSIV